jgi:hypothetical protein
MADPYDLVNANTLPMLWCIHRRTWSDQSPETKVVSIHTLEWPEFLKQRGSAERPPTVSLQDAIITRQGDQETPPVLPYRLWHRASVSGEPGFGQFSERVYGRRF